MTITGDEAAGQWLRCFCCGLWFEVGNMVRFEKHPEDGVCVGCATWLHHRSQPIIRKIYPQFWHRLQGRRARDAARP